VAVSPSPARPSFEGAAQEKLARKAVKPTAGVIKLDVALQIPRGWKINLDAPMSYWLDSTLESGAIDRATFGRTKLTPAAQFEVPLRVAGTGEDEVRVALNYYYCQDKADGVCKTGAVVFSLPLEISDAGSAAPVKLTHVVPD